MNQRSQEIFNDVYEYFVSMFFDLSKLSPESSGISEEELKEGFEQFFKQLRESVYTMVQSILGVALPVPEKLEQEYVLQSILILMCLLPVFGFDLVLREDFSEEMNLEIGDLRSKLQKFLH